MKIIKLIFKFVWTVYLQNLCLWAVMLWKWLWSKTEVDDKAIAAVKEAKRRVENAADELDDVADALKGKKYKSNGGKKK